MTWYTFEQHLAVTVVDGVASVALGAAGTVYAVDDTSFANPLTAQEPAVVTSLDGAALEEMVSDTFGLLPALRIDGHPIVVWKSGDHEMVMASISGIIGDAQTASAQATAAAASAELAANRAALAEGPADPVVAALFADANSETRQVADLVFATSGGVDATAIHQTGAESKAGILTLTDGVTIPSGATLTVATGGTLTLPSGAVEIIEVNGLTSALAAKAAQTSLDTTNSALAGKVDATPYNGFDMVALDVGVTTIPGDFGTGLVIYLTD